MGKKLRHSAVYVFDHKAKCLKSDRKLGKNIKLSYACNLIFKDIRHEIVQIAKSPTLTQFCKTFGKLTSVS